VIEGFAFCAVAKSNLTAQTTKRDTGFNQADREAMLRKLIGTRQPNEATSYYGNINTTFSRIDHQALRDYSVKF